MCEDVFHVCQAVSKEVVSLPAAINLKHTLTLSTQVEISKYYLDRRPLSHTLNSQLPVQQYFEPPPNSGSIEIGDFIQVLDGEHAGKRGIVDWLSKADTKLWFRDFFTPVDRVWTVKYLSSYSDGSADGPHPDNSVHERKRI
jgi:hypothetical protein